MAGINRVTRSVDYNIPSPVGGLNARDSLDKMPETDAIQMDNYYPDNNRVVLRRGYTEYCRIGAGAKTLVEYKKPNEDRFIGIAGGKAYDLTSIASDKTAPYFSDVEFNEDGCQTAQYKDRLYFVNGTDTPQVFYVDDEGDEWFQDWGFTADNLVPSRIINVGVAKERLWFVEKDTLKVWYPEVAGNIAGNLHVFDFAQVARLGGRLVGVANWTQDGGAGIDDLTVFLTSEGEALVYAGTNPDDPNAWELKGKYFIPKPVGYRCTMQYQGDVIIITEDGYIPLARALPLQNANASQVAFSDKIRTLLLERMKNGKNKKGWQSVIYPRGGYALFNVPVNQQFEQHIFNLNTGATARFTNMRAFCWGIFGDRIYFGSDNSVFLFDEGYTDNGDPIQGVVKQAFSNLGSPSIKKIQLLNPRTKSSKRFALTIYTDMDYEDRDLQFAQNIGDSGVTKWSSIAFPVGTKWSSLKNPVGTKWGTLRGTIKSQWLQNSATGFKAAIVFKTSTKGNIIEWFDTGIRYENGNAIL